MNTVAHSMEEGHTADEFAPYIAGLVRRERARRRRMRQRATQALEAARAAADLLRRRYGATRVRLFGSVLHPRAISRALRRGPGGGSGPGSHNPRSG